MGVVGSQFNDFAILFPHSAKDSFVAFFSSALVVNVASPSVEIVSNFDLHYFNVSSVCFVKTPLIRFALTPHSYKFY